MPTTVWITKWALTSGIFEKTGCEIKDGYATRDSGHCSNYVFARMGKDAFETKAEAEANTLVRAQRRLKALAKEKAKLEALVKTLGCEKKP